MCAFGLFLVSRRYEQSKQLLLLAYLINKSKHMQIVADLVDDAVRKIRGRFVFEKNVRTRLIWHPCRGAEIFLGMLPVVSNAGAFSTTGYHLSSLRDGGA